MNNKHVTNSNTCDSAVSYETCIVNPESIRPLFNSGIPHTYDVHNLQWMAKIPVQTGILLSLNFGPKKTKKNRKHRVISGIDWFPWVWR